MRSIATAELEPGHVLVEIRRKRNKEVEIRTKVKTVRRGGHVPTSRIIGKDKDGNHVLSEPVAVDPVPKSSVPFRNIVVNESLVYDRAGRVLVD